MGMKQKRCPRCKKRRRWVEGYGKGSARYFPRGPWRVVGGVFVCPLCVKEIEAEEAS